MIMDILKTLVGAGAAGKGNAITETIGAFIPNAENEAEREATRSAAALSQFAQEFSSPPRKHWFDSFIDGVNRIPRPMMAIGVIGLFVSAMVDPTWFASRMVGIALVPEPLWWLLGAIVAFYFGGRHQVKVQEYSIDKQVKGVKAVIAGRRMIDTYEAEDDAATDMNVSAANIKDDLAETSADPNPVIEAWSAKNK